MSRKENWSVSELIVTKGIRAGRLLKLAKVLKFFVCTPATIVANRYFASAAMHNGAYAVANGGLPGDGLAHSVTCAVTAVDVADTMGKLTIVGTDIDGKVISEDIIPAAGSTVEGNLAFKSVTSITGSGWVQGGTGPDNIVIGFGEKVGLPDYIGAAADILMVGFDTAIVNAPTVAVDTSVLAKNVVTTPTGNGTKKLRVLYQV
jgi:hypothetical protein